MMQVQWKVTMAMLLGVLISFLAGCGNQSREPEMCQAIISRERLPVGWRMLPTSEMPPGDKMPWWKHNPLLLKGSEVKQLDVEGKPTSASKVWAAIYMKDGHELLIFCLQYPTPDAALAEFDLFAKGYSPDKGMLGLSREHENTIVVLSLSSDCPDRDFFINHFKAISREWPASHSVHDAK